MRSRIPPIPLALCLLATLAACGSRGGGGEPSVALSFTATALEVGEEAGDVLVVVRLHAPPAGLTAPASAQVADAGTGSATAGADYVALAPQVLSFPAGSLDGAVQSVTLTVIDDATVEGATETVVLELSLPEGGGLLAPRRLTLSITDAQQATIRFASSLSATVDESTQSHPVGVTLELEPGVTLGLDVSARVADSHGGNATAGADYASFPTRTLVFGAGSASGSTQTVDVDVLDDSTIEGDESVVLALSQASAGSVLGGVGTHQLTIRDDDSGEEAFLAASEGPTGIENPLDSDDPIALGSQAVGAGPNAGTLLRLTNLGQLGLTLGAPDLSGNHPQDFAIEIESLSAPPPQSGAGLPELGTDVIAPIAAAVENPLTGVVLALDGARLAELAPLAAVTLHEFPLPGEGPVTLELRRLPLPIEPDAVLAVDGLAQPGGLQAALAGLSVWRGSVLERPGSRVLLALSSDGARGFVELADTTDRLVHVLTEAAPAGGLPLVRVAREWQLEELGMVLPPQTCAGAIEVPGLVPPQPQGASTPTTAGLSAATCRLALESDYQLFQKLGSVGATTSYVTSLIAAVSDRYLVDVQASLSIAYLGVYSTPADPWATPDGPGSTSDMLAEFRTAWNASGWPAPADLAHFVSGASLGGGIAYVNVLCSQSFGYGVSGNLNGNINWGTWTGAKGSFTWDFVVIAHELGHNFGTNHTHAYCPPLDQCYSNCNGTTACSVGTLMSYCHVCSGGGGMNAIKLEFHPVVADVMRAAVNASCLGQSALAGGDWVRYRLRFNPLGGTGARNAELRFTHGASNQPSPFRLQLSGSATP